MSIDRALSTRVLPRPSVGSPPSPTVPRPARFTLENGLGVVAIPRGDLPQVATRLVLRAGSAADLPACPGAASLTASLLTEGTDRFTAVELNERIDQLGASLCARAGHDFAEVDLGVLAETLEDGLPLLAEVVARSVFPDREVERIRAEALDAFEARLDEPANVADDRAALGVFGEKHPYSRVPLGTPEGVRRLSRSDLVDFHSTRYRPAGAVLVIAGDFDLARLRDTLERCFADWTGGVGPVRYPEPPRASSEAGRLVAIDWDEGAQGEIRIAGIGLPRDSDDWIPASVANYILGGSTITGRLGANLREEKGWTYGVRSAFAAGIHPAGWSVETAVGAEVTPDAIREIERELARISEEPVTEEELLRAREALILSLPRAFETPGRIVGRFATLEAFSLSEDYWERFPAKVAEVTRDDVQRVAQQYFAPERLVRVAVRPSAPVA